MSRHTKSAKEVRWMGSALVVDKMNNKIRKNKAVSAVLTFPHAAKDMAACLKSHGVICRKKEKQSSVEVLAEAYSGMRRGIPSSFGNSPVVIQGSQ